MAFLRPPPRPSLRGAFAAASQGHRTVCPVLHCLVASAPRNRESGASAQSDRPVPSNRRQNPPLAAAPCVTCGLRAGGRRALLSKWRPVSPASIRRRSKAATGPVGPASEVSSSSSLALASASSPARRSTSAARSTASGDVTCCHAPAARRRNSALGWPASSAAHAACSKASPSCSVPATSSAQRRNGERSAR